MLTLISRLFTAQKPQKAYQKRGVSVKKKMETDVTKTKAWKAGLFVILIIFTFFITGTGLLNLQSKKQDPSKEEQVAFEIYTKYSKQLNTIRGKN